MLAVRFLQDTIRLDCDIVMQRIPSSRLGAVQTRLRTQYGDAYRWLAQYEAVKDFDCMAQNIEEFRERCELVKRQFSEALAALRLLRTGKVGNIAGLMFEPLDEVHTDLPGTLRGYSIDPGEEIYGLPDYRLQVADVP